MRQPGDGLDLPVKPLHRDGIGEQVLVDEFQRDLALHAPMPRLEDPAHPPFAQALQEQILTAHQALPRPALDLGQLEAGQPSAAQQLIGQRSEIAEAREALARKSFLLGRIEHPALE